jgi:hypothetical protein
MDKIKIETTDTERFKEFAKFLNQANPGQRKKYMIDFPVPTEWENLDYVFWTPAYPEEKARVPLKLCWGYMDTDWKIWKLRGLK